MLRMTSSSLTPFLYQTRTIIRVSPQALGRRTLSTSAAHLDEFADVFVTTPIEAAAKKGQTGAGVHTESSKAFYRNIRKVIKAVNVAEEQFFAKFEQNAINSNVQQSSLPQFQPAQGRIGRKRRSDDLAAPPPAAQTETSQAGASRNMMDQTAWKPPPATKAEQPWWMRSQLESTAIAQPPAMGVYKEKGDDVPPRFEFYRFEPGDYAHVTYPESEPQSASSDTAPADTAPTDTAPTDTAPTDTAPTDTAPTDTAPTDAQDPAPTWRIRPDVQERDMRGEIHVPFDFEVPTPVENGNDVEHVREERSPLSTLTRAEKDIFENIFDELVVTGHRAKVEDARTLGRGRAKSIQELNEAAQSALRFIVKDATYAANQGDLLVSRTLVDQVRNATYRDRMLRKYPSSIRQVAVKTLGLHTNDTPLPKTRLANIITTHRSGERHKSGDRPDMLLQRLKEMGVAEESVEKERQVEWRRLKDMIVDADTDKDLWNVLVEHVFSIPKQLGVDEALTRPGVPGKTDFGLALTPKKEEHLDIDVYGPLYPALLIAAHRQLVRNFSPTSPLVYSLLPRVKALGLTSYVLGASSTLYNETMMLYWTHRGDLRTVLALLEEMETAGLFADPHTEKLLKRINNTLSVCEGGRGGWTGFVPSMMKFGGFAAGIRAKLVDAHWKVKEAIEQRGLELLT